jgi:hypothetical protein
MRCRKSLRDKKLLGGGYKLTDEPGRVMRKTRGKAPVSDGPYAESREVLGGYFVVKAKKYDEAANRDVRSGPGAGVGTSRTAAWLHADGSRTMCVGYDSASPYTRFYQKHGAVETGPGSPWAIWLDVGALADAETYNQAYRTKSLISCAASIFAADCLAKSFSESSTMRLRFLPAVNTLPMLRFAAPCTVAIQTVLA